MADHVELVLAGTGAATATLGGGTAIVHQGNKRCGARAVRRLAQCLAETKAKHPGLHSALLAGHALVSGFLFIADVGTDAVATADIKAQGQEAWKVMLGFMLLPVVIMWLGMLRYAYKKGAREALVTFIVGVPLVPLLDVLMLLLKVPLLEDVLRARFGSDEARNFMTTYAAARMLVETFVESLPQLVIQSYLSVSTGGNQQALLLSIIFSFVDFAWVFTNNYVVARRSGKTLPEHFAMLLRIGGGAFETGLHAVANNSVAELDLQRLELGPGEARQLATAMRTNT